MKNVKAYVRTTLTAGLILAAAVLGGCSKSDAGSSAADTAAASSGTESAASADASNSNKKELKYGKAAALPDCRAGGDFEPLRQDSYR